MSDESTIENVQNEYGTPQEPILGDKGKIKAKKLKDILLFPKYDCLVGLQLVAEWDPELKRYKEDAPVPRMLGLIGGTFANFPTEPEFWEEFSPFCLKMAAALGKIKIPERNREVVDNLDELDGLVAAYNLR